MLRVCWLLRRNLLAQFLVLSPVVTKQRRQNEGYLARNGPYYDRCPSFGCFVALFIAAPTSRGRRDCHTETPPRIVTRSLEATGELCPAATSPATRELTDQRARGVRPRQTHHVNQRHARRATRQAGRRRGAGRARGCETSPQPLDHTEKATLATHLAA